MAGKKVPSAGRIKEPKMTVDQFKEFFRSHGCRFNYSTNSITAETRGWGPTAIALAEVRDNNIVSVTTISDQIVDELRSFPEVQVFKRRSLWTATQGFAGSAVWYDTNRAFILMSKSNFQVAILFAILTLDFETPPAAVLFFANAAEGGVGEFRSVCHLPPPESGQKFSFGKFLPHQAFSKKVLAVFSIFHQKMRDWPACRQAATRVWLVPLPAIKCTTGILPGSTRVQFSSIRNGLEMIFPNNDNTFSSLLGFPFNLCQA